MVFLESCKTGLILLLVVVWCGICGLSNKFQRHTEFNNWIWPMLTMVLTMEGILCNWKLGVASLPKYWENTKGVHHFKKNSVYQKMEVYVNISIFYLFFLELHQWREILMINPMMAMNPLLPASGQQRIPVIPSPFEPPSVDRYSSPMWYSGLRRKWMLLSFQTL